MRNTATLTGVPGARFGIDRRGLGLWLGLTGLLGLLPIAANAISLTTVESQAYLIIGQSINDSVIASNFELGANQAAVPMPGLTLVEAIPANTLAVATGISGDGNIAVVDPAGQFNLSNLDIFASQDVQCAASAVACNNGASNTTFNTLPFPANGLTGGVSFTNLMLELDAAEAHIPTLTQTSVLDLTGLSGEISGGTTMVTLALGLNVIDILTGGNDFKITNANFVIDGPANSSVIFRVPDSSNMLVSQSAILVGDSGIGLNDVMFFSNKDDNSTHFDFNSVLINGVAFWDMSMFGDPSEIRFNNVQGCTQVVGNKVNAGQDVRLTRCEFAPVPEPTTGLLLAGGLLALALGRRSLR